MTLLPQRPPFVMVDALSLIDDKTTVSSTVIRKSCILMDGNHLSPSGIIENMAQTCAARIGYINKFVRRKGIQIGFIGAIRNLEIGPLPTAGDELITEIEVIEEVFGMTLVEARSYNGDVLIAKATMKIALADKEINEENS